MSVNYPNNPTLGQLYTLPSGVVMECVKVAPNAIWKAKTDADKSLRNDLSLGDPLIAGQQAKRITLNIDTVFDIPTKVLPRDVGRRIAWGGYYAFGDGGSNWGTVKEGSHIHDGFRIFSVSGFLYVEANITTNIHAKKAGVIAGNGDLTARVKACINLANNLALEATKTLGVWLPVGAIPISGGDSVTPCLDFSNYKGAFFKGKGKGRSIFRYTGSANIVIALNKGVNGSGGSIENIEVGGFYVDCTGSTANIGVYADNFRRGLIFDIEVLGANVGFKYRYGWITKLDRLTSTNHKVKGFDLNGDSINGVVGNLLSATTNVVSAVNFDILANSLTLIAPISEGTPSKGFLVSAGSRKVTIKGAHTEGNNTGIFSEATDINGSNLTVKDSLFYSCDNPLVMSQRIRSLTFTGNICQPKTNPGNVTFQINAQQFKYSENNIVNANVAQEVGAVSVVGSNSMDYASVSVDGFSLKFNAESQLLEDRDIVYPNVGPHDIQTYKTIAAGCSGKLQLICRLSATNTSEHTVKFRVSEDGVASFSNVSQLGTALIAAIGYNSASNKVTVQVTASVPGNPCYLCYDVTLD